MPTNRDVAFEAAAEDITNAIQLRRRALDFFAWLEAQPDVGLAQAALWVAVRASESYQSTGAVLQEAQRALVELAANPPGNSTGGEGGGASTLAELSDVNITSQPSAGEILATPDGVTWSPRPPDPPVHPHLIDDLSDVNTTDFPPDHGDQLHWDAVSGEWQASKPAVHRVADPHTGVEHAYVCPVYTGTVNLEIVQGGGLIFASPNGQRYKLCVDDNGVLFVDAVPGNTVVAENTFPAQIMVKGNNGNGNGNN